MLLGNSACSTGFRVSAGGGASKDGRQHQGQRRDQQADNPTRWGEGAFRVLAEEYLLTIA